MIKLSENRKNICVRLFICVFLLIFAYYLVRCVFGAKRGVGNESLHEFYLQRPQSIDVLLLGTSHTGADLDLEPFWNSYGISAFSLWSPYQRLEESYYSLIEVLKTQTPKVLILDLTSIFDEGLVNDWDRRRESTVAYFSRMPFSLNKVNAVRKTVLRDEWQNIFLGVPISHQRYDALVERDFHMFSRTADSSSYKGAYYVQNYKGCDMTEPERMDEEKPLTPAEEEKLRDIIDLAKQNEIPILLVKTPLCRWGEMLPYLNTARKIAEEYQVPMIDMNRITDEIGIFSEDYCGDRSDHLNPSGARKTGIWLADYITERYDLPDHRGDPDYASWDVFAWSQRCAYLPENPSLEMVLEDLRYGNRAVFAAKNGYQEGEEFDAFLEALSPEEIGLDTESLRSDEYGVWMTEDFGGAAFESQYEGGLSADIRYEDKSFFFNFLNEFTISSEGTKWIDRGGNSLVFLAYDRDYDDILYAVKFEAITGYAPIVVKMDR